MDRSIRTALAIAAASLTLLAAGCGEGGKESAHRGMSVDEAARQAFGVNEAGVGYVGSENCVGCHQDPTCTTCHPTMDLKTVVVDKYLESGHVIHSGTLDASAGNAGCRATCHDPVGDGRDLEAFLPPEDVPALGLAAVTCEACHGAGGRHFGAGPITDPRPTFEVCGSCHNGTMTALHDVLTPEGGQIAEKYAASKHVRSIATPTLVPGTTSDVEALCSKCHTDEGAKEYLGVNGPHDDLEAAFPDDPADPAHKPAVADATPVQCRTCHDPHVPGRLLVSDETDAGGVVTASGQYRTCTNCHQFRTDAPGLTDGFHGEKSAFAWSDRVLGVGTFRPGQIIYDSHFDDPATDTIEGYVVDAASERACVGCHNPHEAVVDIAVPRGQVAPPSTHQQWAASGHGGHILLKKQAAAAAVGAGEADVAPILAGILTAGVTTADSAAWTRYDFKFQSADPRTDRSSCQRCHTTTGFVNYAADPARYNPANNEFAATGLQREMLYCYGCHADNNGGVRDPGPIDPDYPSDNFRYVDLGDSNVCVPCHAGQNSGASIANSTADFTNLSLITSHYLTAAGVQFSAIGYEFAGRSYVNVDKYKHDRIGVPGALDVDTGSAGPCVTCHMSSGQKHTFLPVTHDETGAVTAVTTQLCDTCHTPAFDGVMTPDLLNTEREHYEAAIEALADQLDARGYYTYDAYPYILSQAGLNPADPTFRNFAVKNWVSAGDAAGKNNMGAAFNWLMLHHEPGAYAHNRYYTRKLLYDSIDWLDDNVLNNSVMLTLNALDGTVKTFKDGAMAYLGDVGR